MLQELSKQDTEISEQMLLEKWHQKDFLDTGLPQTFSK